MYKCRRFEEFRAELKRHPAVLGRPFVENEVMKAETRDEFCKMAKQIMSEKQIIKSAE